MRIQTLLLTLATIMVISCRTGYEENKTRTTPERDKFIGAWNVTDFDANIPSLSADDLEAAHNEAISAIYEFNADSTMMLTSAVYQEGIGGDWSFEPEGGWLEITLKRGGKTQDLKYLVETLEKEEITLAIQVRELGDYMLTLNRKVD